MATIKDLHKNDIFEFNDIEYIVQKKYKDDDHPLVAYNDFDCRDEYFFNEDLEIVILSETN